jgi:hypothetical protein
MRIRGIEVNDKTLVLGLAAAYAACVVIALSLLIHDTVWRAVSHAL